MINLDFYLAVSLYIIVLLTSVLLYWLFSRSQKYKELSLDPQFIWYCSVCTYTYINTKEDRLSTCPRCGSYNKK